MPDSFLLFVAVGFAAQLIDGAIGMAYGVISATILISLGIPPVNTSAIVHISEIPVMGISGFSHTMFKNIDIALLKRLAIPGVLGSIIGSYVLTKIPTTIAKPIVATYLLMMGFFILYKASKGEKFTKLISNFFIRRLLKRKLPSDHVKGVVPLGFAAGFFSTIGGGGWGPIVTSTLLAQDTTPHYTVGSVNLSEFFVALSSSATFFFLIKITHWNIILGLITGGSIAAPIAALMVRRIHPKIIMLLAGIIVILLSLRNLFLVFF